MMTAGIVMVSTPVAGVELRGAEENAKSALTTLSDELVAAAPLTGLMMMAEEILGEG